MKYLSLTLRHAVYGTGCRNKCREQIHLIIIYAYMRARRQSQAPAKTNYLKTTALCKLFVSIRTPIHAKTLYLQMT